MLRALTLHGSRVVPPGARELLPLDSRKLKDELNTENRFRNIQIILLLIYVLINVLNLLLCCILHVTSTISPVVLLFVCFFNRNHTDKHFYIQISSATDVMITRSLAETNLQSFMQICTELN